jgi:hypothetical protein
VYVASGSSVGASRLLEGAAAVASGLLAEGVSSASRGAPGVLAAEGASVPVGALSAAVGSGDTAPAIVEVEATAGVPVGTDGAAGRSGVGGEVFMPGVPASAAASAGLMPVDLSCTAVG